MGKLSKEELIVKNYLEYIRFVAEKIEDGNKKRTDFKVYNKNNEVVFFLEVKTREALNEDFCGKDSTYNYLSRIIHDSVKQFKSINPNHFYPNVLAIVNKDISIDVRDLKSVITGYFETSSGKRIYALEKIAKGKIKHDKLLIDLYLWFQLNEGKIYIRYNEDSPHNEKIRSLFNDFSFKEIFIIPQVD